MKVIVIYGSPAAGKLTVGRELQKLTGYKLMHNHLTLDLINAIFDDYHAHRTVLRRIRLDVVQAALRTDIAGLIMTYTYQLEDGLDFLNDLVDLVEQSNGEVDFVQLKCDQEELERRVTDESRRIFTKTNDVATLRSTLARPKVFDTVPFENNLVIDTTRQEPSATAQEIKQYYRL